MKYYVCSPMGRSGSKRIVNSIWTEFETKQKMYIPPMQSELSPSGDGFEHIEDFLDGFRIVTKVTTATEETKKYSFDEAIALMDSWPTPIVCHSHNPNILPTNGNDWTFILSTRRKKIDIALSIVMAKETKSYDPLQPIDSSFKPFTANIEEVETLLKYTNILENIFIENVKKLTDDTPKIIFVEDSWTTLEEKIGIQLNHKEHDKATISTHRADKYIINYQEIIEKVK